MQGRILFDDVADFLSSENRLFVAENYELSNEEIEKALDISHNAVAANRRELRRHKLGKIDTEHTGAPNELGAAVIARYNEMLDELGLPDNPELEKPFQESLTAEKARKYFQKVPENKTHVEIYKSYFLDGNDGTWAYNRLEDAGLVQSDVQGPISESDRVHLTEAGESVNRFRKDVELKISNYSPEDDLLLPSD